MLEVKIVKKILKVEKKPLVSSECWTYYKFSVMQTVSNFYEWLSCHMKIYIDQNGNSVFGENGYMYPLSYFSDILNIHDGNIMSKSKKDIVDYLIEQIDNGVYVIVDLNYRRINGKNDNTFWLHETLIYGYDKSTKEFLTPLLSDGSFKESRISFDKLEDAFDDAIKYYSEDKNRLFNRRTWFFGITCIKPNRNYRNANAYFDFISKLKSELDGSIYKKYKSVDGIETENGYSYAMGLSCLSYLAAYMKKIIIENHCTPENIRKCRKSCTKIYENQSIIKSTLEWFINTQEYSNTILESLLFEYQRCCDIMLLNVRRFYKYHQNQDGILLEKIINDLNHLYMQERLLLERLIEEFKMVYKSKL